MTEHTSTPDKFPVATANLQRAERMTNREIAALIESRDELVAALRGLLEMGPYLDDRNAARAAARAALAKAEG